MEQHNLIRLMAHILPLSQAQTFESAISEWDLVAVELSDEFDNCPCGQEIKEHCYIRNRVTGRNTYVGNVCIRRFLKIDTGTLFDGLKRIRDDRSANANEALIEYAMERGFLWSDKEYQFLHDTKKKRNLSQSQIDWKVKINRRILNETVVGKRTVRGGST